MLDFAQPEIENLQAANTVSPGSAAAPLAVDTVSQALQTLARDLPFEQLGLTAFDPDCFAWWPGSDDL